MADANQSLDARRMAREQEGRMAATAFRGLNVAQPFVQFQTSMLRMLAENSRRRAIMKRASKPLATSSRTKCPSCASNGD